MYFQILSILLVRFVRGRGLASPTRARILAHHQFCRETFLDKKILSALLKSNNMDLHTQLYLAMIWDRVDLAEEKILAGASIQACEYISQFGSGSDDLNSRMRTHSIEFISRA